MKITVRPEENENNLLRLLQKKGAAVSAPCGGNGHCGRCTVFIDEKPVLACRTFIDGPTLVDVPNAPAIHTNDNIPETRSVVRKNLDFAVDIGTTTVAVALVEKGTTVETITFDNPQISFGADVLTRIRSAKETGVTALQKPLLTAIKNHVDELCKKYDCVANALYVCGNTVMLHIFWGEEIASLGVAPYTPVFLQKREGTLSCFGAIKILSLPCVSSYVGADIVAGISVCDRPEEGKYRLLVDLGTNAEIALIGKETVLTTSASAGPCFEAGNVSCGMPARDGAIKSFALSDGKKKISYFGLRPQGLCGTGLIDVIGQLVKYGIIDNTGYLIDEKGYLISNDIILTQEDVRAYQMAKSAVRSGIETLLKEADCSSDDVEKVYLSGGFSSYVNVENAVLSGLLPPAFIDKCVAVGNSALSGTIAYTVSPEKVEKTVGSSRYIDMGGLPLFSELFIKNLNFS